MLEGKDLPAYRARTTGEKLYLFPAHPKAEELTYPLDYGQSHTEDNLQRPLTIRFKGHTVKHTVHFAPHESVILQVDAEGRLKEMEISYRPPEPEYHMPLHGSLLD